MTSALCVAQEKSAAEIALEKEISAKTQELAAARLAGLDSVTVNGVTVPAEAVMREAVFLVGAKMIDARIADFFIEEHLEEAIANGRDPKEFEVSDKQLTDDVEAMMVEFQKKNPGVSLWEAVRVQYGMDREQYLHSRRQTILFDRVFFPGPSTEWPTITREAIMASSSGGDGKAFIENIDKAAVGPDGKPRELPAFWMQLCRGWVQKQLKSWSDIRYPSDGLPADVCLSVNDSQWRTEDAFEQIRGGLYVQDIERAMTEVVVREALRQELAKREAYLSDEDFRSQFQEYREQFDNTPFTTEVIAVNFKGYPSLEAFRQRWRLIRSFEQMIDSEINDEVLQAHADKHAGFFSNGTASVDMIQFLGRDIKTGAWLPTGMEDARKRAEAAMKEIEGGKDFESVLAERGEFYANDQDKGRLSGKSLNQLKQHFHESEFTDLITGTSIGYFMFFEAERGNVYGPLRGPDSYYIARTTSTAGARSKVTIKDGRMRDLVRQDYVNHRFFLWANEIVQNASVE